MQTFTHTVNGDETLIHFPETDGDIWAFNSWMSSKRFEVLALDTETTGLKIYTRGYACRLIQIGDEATAWVIQAERFRGPVTQVLRDPSRTWVLHNAPFDLLVLDRMGFADLTDLGPRCYDTYILGHLCDPRLKAEGGTGLGLKELSAVYVDANAEDTQAGLYKVFRSEYKATKDTGWALIDIDHPLYVRYAGLDVIYCRRLLTELGILVKGNNLSALAHWEHKVQMVTTKMRKRGLLIDVDYTKGLVNKLADEQAHHADLAAKFGVSKVNAPAQVAEALLGMGEDLRKKTATNNPSTAKEVLLPMADLDRDWQRIGARDPNPLADAVLRAKRAGKWRTSYAQAFLDGIDEDNRLHPSIKTLAARTARMSISDPALQQLPSSDWLVRRCFVADDNQSIFSVDYQAVEMRVLAALSGDPALKAAIANGVDLHMYTAEKICGGRWAGMDAGARLKMRKIAKVVGLAKVYGGGAAHIAEQTGISLADAKAATLAYDTAFPGIKAYGLRLQREAGWGARPLITHNGRHLPLDRDRTYAATNYSCQSVARDILAGAAIRLDEAGLTEHLLLPIHDEFLGQGPIADVADLAHEVQRVMETELLGVHIAADPEVYGDNWGLGYKGPSRYDLAA